MESEPGTICTWITARLCLQLNLKLVVFFGHTIFSFCLEKGWWSCQGQNQNYVHVNCCPGCAYIWKYLVSFFLKAQLSAKGNSIIKGERNTHCFGRSVLLEGHNRISSVSSMDSRWDRNGHTYEAFWSWWRRCGFPATAVRVWCWIPAFFPWKMTLNFHLNRFCSSPSPSMWISY